MRAFAPPSPAWPNFRPPPTADPLTNPGPSPDVPGRACFADQANATRQLAALPRFRYIPRGARGLWTL